MAIITREIVDNSHIFEMVIIGQASLDTYTIDSSALDDSVTIDGVDKQRLSINLEYSLSSNCELLVEFATNPSGSFTGIESGIIMSISGLAPTTTLDDTAELIGQSSTSGSGSSATFNIKSEGGVITEVTSVQEGTGYSDGDTITFTAADLTSLGTLGTVTGDLVLTVLTGAKQWKAYGTGNIFIKNTILGSNGDIRLTFNGGAGCCKVSAKKTEGFRLVSPYYRKVSGRRA